MEQSTKRRKIFLKVASIVLVIALGVGAWIGIYKWLTPDKDYNYEIYRARTELHYEGLKDSLVTQVDLYIQTTSPGSSVDGLVLVEMCDKYNINLKFALAQGHLESHFGTKGIASKTNSVFNVFSFDGLSADQIIKKGRGYKYPNFSIEPYCRLLTERYLVDKTEEDLFIKFEDINGNRYASDKKYEERLLNIYKSIDSVANLGVYKDYIKYKIILGR